MSEEEIELIKEEIRELNIAGTCGLASASEKNKWNEKANAMYKCLKELEERRNIIVSQEREIQTLTESNNKFEMKNIRLNNIITELDGWLEQLYYLARSNETRSLIANKRNELKELRENN